MADLLSHVLVNQIAGQRVLSRPELACFVSGALLPDLGSRVPRVLLQGALRTGLLEPGETARMLVMGVDVPHQPVGFALVCIALGALLPERLAPPHRWRAAWLLYLGGLLHLAADLLQSHIAPGYRYLEPLHPAAFELGVVGTEATLLAIPLLAATAWLTRRRAR